MLTSDLVSLLETGAQPFCAFGGPTARPGFLGIDGRIYAVEGATTIALRSIGDGVGAPRSALRPLRSVEVFHRP